ncbi:MAG: bifunctional heptose 7-phosphate kinase/heptose 1-phosphate adenyltransferase [Planctomycetota bacterium]
MTSRSHLRQMIEKLGKPTVLVIGDFILDRYIWGRVDRISPEAPIPVLAAETEEERPGGVGSVLNNLAALGAKCRAIGVVGDDEEGRRFHGLLDAAGLSGACGTVFTDPRRRTTVKTRLIAKVQHLLRVDQEHTHPLDGELEQALIARALAHMDDSDIILVSDYGKGVVSAAVMEAVVSSARRRGLRVIVDPWRGRDYAHYRRATAVTPNRNETQIATGIRLEATDAYEKAARRLIREYELDAVVITLDRDGIYCAEGSSPGRLIPTRPRAIFDVTGAGDIVLSVLGVGLASGLDLESAAELANLAAGVEVEKLGAAPVSICEMLNAVSDSPHHARAKVVSEEELLSKLAEHRRRGERIVLANGCFDLLHAGHAEFLAFARRQGDTLVVALNSDSSVAGLKGPDRPFQSQSERARILAALGDVNYVVVFDEPTPERIVRSVRPDVLVKGEDWRERGVVGREFVESYGGTVVLAPLVEGVSTTQIVSSIRQGGGGVRERT